MTTLILAARAKLRDSTVLLRTGGMERCVFVLGLLGLALLDPTLRPVVLGSLADAYLGVGVFVAATFGIFYLVEDRFRIDVSALLERHRHAEIPVAALLGALPGCGGAVMVITQYALGRASFGAVVAVLTATMGDAAFLVLAREPLTGLGLMGAGLVVGTLFGWVVNVIHGRDFLRVDRPAPPKQEVEAPLAPVGLWRAWGWVLVPGLVLAVLALAQVGVDEALGIPLLTSVGVLGALLSLVLWALSPSQAVTMAALRPSGSTLKRVALQTNFVTVWVILGFLAFGLATDVGGLDLGRLFGTAPAMLPLLAVLVGFLPGCGPQIVVSTLYLNGWVPLSAQLGNAISNDGDALFPAIAIAPRAAVVATLYTAVPALLMGYGYLLLFE